MLTPIHALNVLLLAEQDGGGGMFTSLGFLWPLLIIGLLFYFLLIRPEQRKRADQNRMQEGLKKNDRIVTIGGILGSVVNAQDGSDEVTIRVDDNSKLRILRSAIARVLTSENEGEKKSAD